MKTIVPEEQQKCYDHKSQKIKNLLSANRIEGENGPANLAYSNHYRLLADAESPGQNGGVAGHRTLAGLFVSGGSAKFYPGAGRGGKAHERRFARQDGGRAHPGIILSLPA